MQLAAEVAAREVLEGVGALVRAVRCLEHRQVWPDGGLRRADAGVLKVLAKGGEQRGGEIAARLGVDASVVSRQVHALVAEGLVSRRTDPADARGSLVQLSPAGRERLETLYEGFAQRLRDSLADWDAAELTAAAATLRHVAEAVTKTSGVK